MTLHKSGIIGNNRHLPSASPACQLRLASQTLSSQSWHDWSFWTKNHGIMTYDRHLLYLAEAYSAHSEHSHIIYDFSRGGNWTAFAATTEISAKLKMQP